MATIKLDENFRIEGDTYNWSLMYESKREDTDKDGKAKTVTSKDEWHYPTISACLLKYLNTATKVCNSITELKEKLDEIKATIEALNVLA